MRTSTIVNKRSGGWVRHEPLLTKLARQSDSPIRYAGGDRPVRELIREAIDQGCQRLIVAGGDGSVSRIVNAMAPRFGEIELAILPVGTGNDLARSLGVFGESLEVAWRHAVEGKAAPIDVVRISNGSNAYFVNAATGGFGGKVSTDVHSDDKQMWGAIAYWMTAFYKLGELVPFHVRLETDQETIAATLFGLAIANGRYVGGGFPAAPLAFLNDGLLDVTTVPVLPPLELLAAGVDFALGRHQDSSPAKTFQTSRLHLHSEPDMPISVDGEPTRAIDATFEVLPRVLPIVHSSAAVAVQADPDDPGALESLP